jgi:DGQHR domain-containing protein
MSATPFVPEVEVPATNTMNFLAGAFALGKWRIPYFSTTLSFREAAEDLLLTNEMPGTDKIRWTVSELYQRDIDWARVQNDILKYLINTDQPQFFNSITVALLPYSERDSEPASSFGTSVEWQAPKLPSQDSYSKVVEVGPITLGFFNEWTSYNDRAFQLGVIRWNPDQVHGVAIDGQHRLAAIKEFVRKGYTTEGRIPVLILLLDPAVGFEAPEATDMTTMLRRLFIDLNKHAEKVSRARQILLDDRDPISRCVRAFIADQLSPDLSELEARPPRFPLSLIDWHSEQAKFNEGPYLTTVLGVDWIVSTLLGQKTIQDLTAYDKIRDQLRSLCYRLEISLSEALERVDAAQDQERPFSYSEDELNQIAAGFSKAWNAPLAHLLTGLAPYEELIQLRSADGSLSLEWQTWYRLTIAAKDGSDHSTQELRDHMHRLLIQEPPVPARKLEGPLESIDALKKENLAFNVAFQRAYIEAFSLFSQFTDADLDLVAEWGADTRIDLDDIAMEPADELVLEGGSDEYGQDEESTSAVDTPTTIGREMDRSQRFVAALNRVLEVLPSFMDVRCEVRAGQGRVALWSGTLRNPEGGIDFALAASKRASDLLFLIAALVEIQKTAQGDEWGFDDVWAELTDSSEWSFFKKMLWASKRLWARETSMGGRILSAREEDFSVPASQEELRIRLEAIWELLSN